MLYIFPFYLQMTDMTNDEDAEDRKSNLSLEMVVTMSEFVQLNKTELFGKAKKTTQRIYIYTSLRFI